MMGFGVRDMSIKLKTGGFVAFLGLFGAACTSSLPPPPPIEAVPEITSIKTPACKGETFQVYFGSDQKKLDPAGEDMIRLIVKQANACKPSAIEIVGHSDAIGSEDVNQRVSQDRADAVLEALLAADLEVERIAFAAAGETGALTEDNNMVPMNRRVEVRFVD